MYSKPKSFGKFPEVKEQNEEIALDFAEPFQKAKSKRAKKYLLVSIDHFSGWPDAKLLRCPTTKKVLEILKQYIELYGVPKKMRTDPGTVFTSEQFAQFCTQFGIKHITCPVRDHRGNGKIERLIRTINERLRTNKQIIVTKDQSGLSESLYALRVNKKKDCTSPFEKQMGRQPNTLKLNLVSKLLAFSEQDPNLEFEQSDFQDDLDSTVLVRERARGSKLQGTFDKRAGRKIKETAHTVTMLPESSGRPKIYSKRDIAIASKEQKEAFGRAKSTKRKRVSSTTESDASEIVIQRKKAQKKKKKATPEMLVDPYAEDESIPKIIDIATSSTEAETVKQAGPEQKT